MVQVAAWSLEKVVVVSWAPGPGWDWRPERRTADDLWVWGEGGAEVTLEETEEVEECSEVLLEVDPGVLEERLHSPQSAGRTVGGAGGGAWQTA